ncbi:DUF6221 family protein [Streptomyces sp. NPDC006684]|uniref:DUF6221 family protein n=1 Tax=Streptomyces sp. NPDC006684 TaxID=3154477 RepID=UPI003455C5CC
MTADLLAFLRERLDEDAAVARAASPGPWRPGVRSGLTAVEGDGWTVCNADNLDAAHITRHDPVRTLAEVEAKRALLELHHEVEDPQEMQDFCATCDVTGKYPEYPCQTLRLLALPYADHPDYREEWRP